MAYCKKFIVLFLILFILLFNFSSVFASDVESVDTIVINGISISSNSNFFVSNDSKYVSYFELESGYIYHIKNNSQSGSINLVVCNSIPSVNVPYNFLSVLEPSNTYDYIGSGYLYFANTSSSNGANTTVTREKIGSIDNSISDLVDNVGPNALWGVFGNGIDFVFIIVIVAFGLFIIYKLIRGLSKGKSKI